ncbi:4'-phosphopantetheinyl transferase family protein [Elusimicrobiota bacterium]
MKSSPKTRLRIYSSHSDRAVSSDLEHEYLAMMPPKIHAAILRYVRWQDRQAALFGKLLLLRALRTKLNDTWPQGLESLDLTPYGKPFIRGGPEFNISHSGGMVVLAMVQAGKVGIDIEEVRAVDTADFSRHLPEIAHLDGKRNCDDINNIFFDCWTQKEAVLKGHGAGLSVPMEQVVIRGSTALLHGTRWHTRKLLISEAYCCHVATDRQPEEVTIQRVDLLNGDPISDNPPLR